MVERPSLIPGILSNTLDLNAKVFQWKVNVEPGTYSLSLYDGIAESVSGTFEVYDPKTPPVSTATSKSESPVSTNALSPTIPTATTTTSSDTTALAATTR